MLENEIVEFMCTKYEEFDDETEAKIKTIEGVKEEYSEIDQSFILYVLDKYIDV
jgi:hypothetical protein